MPKQADGSYQFWAQVIPAHMVEAIDRYVEKRTPTGDFLMAVLENNLKEAIHRGDEENVHLLPAYVGYCYNEIPSNCWGSKEKVKAWLAGPHKDIEMKLGEPMKEDRGS